MHHTKYKGDCGVACVIHDLIKKNWIVSIPIQEHSPYDLVASNGNTVRRIQVKYRTEDKHGAMEVCLRNSWGNAKRGTVRSEAYTNEDIDVVAVTNGEVIAYVPIDEAAKTESFKVRIRPAKNNQQVKCRYIQEYQSLT